MRVELHAADAGGCGHYRLIWPGHAVHSAGLADVTVLAPDTDHVPSLQVQWDRHSGRPVGLDDSSREDGWPDVLVLQRPLKPHLNEVIPFLQEQGCAVVIELDDAFHAVGPRNAGWSPDLREKLARLRSCVDAADLVTVSTPALGEWVGHDRVRVLRNRVPARYLTVEPERDDVVRVGWAGSINVHRDDLPVIGNGLARALRDHPATVSIVGTGLGVARLLGVPRLEACGWVPLDAYPEHVARLDVGLAPLELTEFNRAKSWLKPLEYAALGVPSVASVTDEYTRLEEDYLGSTTLVSHPAGWRRAISQLLADREEREERGRAAREAVKTCTIENHVSDWADAWTAATVNLRKGYT